MKELLLKVLALCYEISTTTKADVFFCYSPHVNTFSVSYCKEGWIGKIKDTIYLATSENITTKNLKSIISKLKKLKEEVQQ